MGLLLHVEGFAGDEKIASGNIVNAALRVSLEMPVTIGESRRIGPGRHHFGEKQVMGTLNVRFFDNPAFEPADTARRQGRPRLCRSFHQG